MPEANLLIRSARLLAPGSAHHNQVRDLLIRQGQLTRIDEPGRIDYDSSGPVLEGTNLHVSAGWFDLRAHAKDPGYEAKEDLATLSRAAAAGGFTEVALLPNTKPIVQTKEGVQYLRRFGETQLVTLHPMAALTLETDGHDFTEMLDLHHAGAVAFTDGERSAWNADLLLKSLQYLAPVGGLVINRPEEPTLAYFGQMHEGLVSTRLGMKGLPPLAEELMIERDLRLLDYLLQQAGPKPRLHVALLSSVGAVELVRQAKRRGLPVSADVAAHHLALTDEALTGFDTNLKVSPPFRTEADRLALWAGLADGTINAIVTDHHPHDVESKHLEFDQAEFGAIGLETAFAVANTYNAGQLSLENLIEKWTDAPRRLLGLPLPVFEENKSLNLTVFDPTLEWTPTETGLHSRAKNSPFLGITLRGRAVAVINKGQVEVFRDYLKIPSA
ncbi:MAG: dihydroorotase [Cytophagaceae bacterium]|nr:dihydroorotase [Cytophagaceae bacterium]